MKRQRVEAGALKKVFSVLASTSGGQQKRGRPRTPRGRDAGLKKHITPSGAQQFGSRVRGKMKEDPKRETCLCCSYSMFKAEMKRKEGKGTRTGGVRLGGGQGERAGPPGMEKTERGLGQALLGQTRRETDHERSRMG